MNVIRSTHVLEFVIDGLLFDNTCFTQEQCGSADTCVSFCLTGFPVVNVPICQGRGKACEFVLSKPLFQEGKMQLLYCKRVAAVNDYLIVAASYEVLFKEIVQSSAGAATKPYKKIRFNFLNDAGYCDAYCRVTKKAQEKVPVKTDHAPQIMVKPLAVRTLSRMKTIMELTPNDSREKQASSQKRNFQMYGNLKNRTHRIMSQT